MLDQTSNEITITVCVYIYLNTHLRTNSALYTGCGSNDSWVDSLRCRNSEAIIQAITATLRSTPKSAGNSNGCRTNAFIIAAVIATPFTTVLPD